MTTSFSHAAQGRLLKAFLVQPGGMVLAVLTAAGAIVSCWALVAGTPLGMVGRAVWRPATVWFFVGLVIVSWAYKSLMIYWGGEI